MFSLMVAPLPDGLSDTVTSVIGAGVTGLPQPGAVMPIVMSAPPAAPAAAVVLRNVRRSSLEDIREHSRRHERKRAVADHQVRQRQVALVELAFARRGDRPHDDLR